MQGQLQQLKINRELSWLLVCHLWYRCVIIAQQMMAFMYLHNVAYTNTNFFLTHTRPHVDYGDFDSNLVTAFYQHISFKQNFVFTAIFSMPLKLNKETSS